MEQALNNMFNSNNILNINSSKTPKKSSSKTPKKSSSKTTTSIRFLEKLYDFIVKRANHHGKKDDIKRLIKKDVSNTYKKTLKDLYSTKLNNGNLGVDERHQTMLNLIELIIKQDRGGSSLFNTLPSAPIKSKSNSKTKSKKKKGIRS